MKKRILVVLLAAVMLVGMVGCAASSKQDSVSSFDMGGYAEPAMAPRAETEEALVMEAEAMDMADEEAAFEKSTDSGSGLSNGMDTEVISQSTDRKLIYRAYYTIETTEFDTDYELIMEVMKSVGGYPQNSWTNGTKPEEYGDPGRNAEMTLRIPISAFEEFIAELEGVGNVLSKSQSTDDVSAQYFDTEARIRVLNTQMERLEDLLARADKMEDIIVLEREITDVMYQLDSYEGQKRQLDNLIDYTTVTISLMEVNEITTITEGELGLGQKIWKGFKNVGNAMVRFLEGLLIVIVGGAPAWVPIALIVWLIIWLVKRNKRKKAAKADEAKPAKKK